MSTSLIILSSLVIALGIIPFLKPNLTFQYPLVVGMFLSVWLLPQAWAIERDGLAGAFDAGPAWTYMTLCVAFLVFGYFGGRATSRQRMLAKRDEISAQYNEKRMTHASIALLAVGVVSSLLMSQAQEKVENATMWTGVITLYALLAQCLVFAAALTFLIYLRTRSKTALILFIIASATFSPVLLFAVKREFIFQFAMIIVCGLYLVRGLVPSRFILLSACFIGAFIVNNTGSIRSYIKTNDTSLVGALTSSDFFDTEDREANTPKAPEILGAVTDISIAADQGVYHPFRSIYNGAIWRYFPAFIFGREAKDRLTIKDDQDVLSNRYFTLGATRTGFSDTFIDFWYLGVLGFAFLGFFFGIVFELAAAGSLRGQYMYVSMLGTGIHGITHAFQEFVCTLPFLLLVVWLPFRYARITPKERQKLSKLMGARQNS